MKPVLALCLSLAAALASTACGGAKPDPTPEPSPVPTTPDDTAGGDDGAGTPDGKPCVVTGCSGTVCAEEDSGMMTTCEWKDEYACYKEATCERQAGGACGWTQTPELTACLGG